MQDKSSRRTSTRKLEHVFAIFGMTAGLSALYYVWLVSFSSQLPMWPLPGLFLLEIAAATALGTWCIWSKNKEQLPLRGILIWVVVGILLAFAIMRAGSVVIFFASAAGLFAIAAILSDLRQRRSLVIHMGAGLAATLAQIALMLTVIRLL